MAAVENGSRADDLRFGASIALFLLLMGLTMPLAHYFGIRGPAFFPFLLPAVAAMLWMAREAKLRGERKGCMTPAARTYNRRVIPLSLFYIAAILGSIYLYRGGLVTGPLMWGIAVLPALPILGIIWAMGRFLVEEDDEYQRARFVRRALIATGFMLTIATVWGFLEQFKLVPDVPSYWAFILWCMGLGVGALWDKIR